MWIWTLFIDIFSHVQLRRFFIKEKNIDIIGISYSIIQNFFCVNICTKCEIISYFRNNDMLFAPFYVDLSFENIKTRYDINKSETTNKLDNEHENIVFFFYSLSSAEERIK